MQIDIKKSIFNAAKSLDKNNAQRLNELLKDENLFDILQYDINNLGICSFSREPKETLLWSHYANNHKGVCILYEFPERFLTATKNKIVGCSDVSYAPDALTNWFKSPDTLAMDLDSEEFIMALAQKVLTVKSPSWRYEREIRIINVKSGIFKIPRSFIKGICFGLQTPDNDIELIYEIVNKFKNKVDFNRVVKSKSDFDIDIEEYNLALPADS